MAPYYPEFDVKHETDIRCGRSAELAAGRTQTATILAGTSGAFRTRSLPVDLSFTIPQPVCLCG